MKKRVFAYLHTHWDREWYRDKEDFNLRLLEIFDIVIDDNIADNVAYLGNYSKYLGYNMPMGITLESSRESSFTKGLIDYRAMAIADCKPLLTEAFIKLYVATA